MRKPREQLLAATILILVSAVLYILHFVLFHDSRQQLYWTLLDLAIIPVQVLFVSLVLDQLLARREHRALLKKLNMVIGAFFSEAGTRMVAMLAGFLPDAAAVCGGLVPTPGWSDADFDRAWQTVDAAGLRLDSRRASLAGLRAFMAEKLDLVLRLLENPNLLDHDSFTECLWAALHVAEELAARPSLEGLPSTDMDHLSGDLTRAYSRLIREWIAYLKHLKSEYPYLFSLAVRTNPFDPGASAVVR
jgi:hypothetical protein